MFGTSGCKLQMGELSQGCSAVVWAGASGAGQMSSWGGSN